jgi:hypothetical protein
MFPWFPFVFPQICRRNQRARKQFSEGAFLEVHAVSGPESIRNSNTSFNTSENNESSRLQLCYKINTRTAESDRYLREF